MANIQMKSGEFQDLGIFKSVRCVETVPNVRVCDIKFTQGDLTLTEKDFKHICRKLSSPSVKPRYVPRRSIR
jgi:hypothetical protein